MTILGWLALALAAGYVVGVLAILVSLVFPPRDRGPETPAKERP